MKIAVSKAGLQRMKDELIKMKGPDMREHLQALAEAREKGDISENAEYDIARENINMLSIKIANLEERIKNSIVVHKENVSSDSVQLFTKVTFVNTKTDKQLTYSIVTEDEAEPKAYKISINSPLAQGLLGRKMGEQVEVKVPSGVLQLKVLNIESF